MKAVPSSCGPLLNALSTFLLDDPVAVSRAIVKTDSLKTILNFLGPGKDNEDVSWVRAICMLVAGQHLSARLQILDKLQELVVKRVGGSKDDLTFQMRDDLEALWVSFLTTVVLVACEGRFWELHGVYVNVSFCQKARCIMLVIKVFCESKMFGHIFLGVLNQIIAKLFTWKVIFFFFKKIVRIDFDLCKSSKHKCPVDPDFKWQITKPVIFTYF